MEGVFLKMSKFFDITLPVYSKMVIWPRDPEVIVNSNKIISNKETIQVSNIVINSHSGTHVDAPRHFLPQSKGVDKLNLGILIGQAKVINLRVKEKISKVDLEKHNLKECKRLIIKTRNSKYLNKKSFFENYVYLDTDAAQYLVKLGIKLIGIDYYSIEKFKNPLHPVHHLLLKNNIVILEGLDLNSVPAGNYNLIALPLKIKDCDGSPVRAVLLA